MFVPFGGRTRLVFLWVAGLLGCWPTSSGVGTSIPLPVVRIRAAASDPAEDTDGRTRERHPWRPVLPPRVQAIGWTQQAVDNPATDRTAHLVQGVALPEGSTGLSVLSARRGRNFGTDELVGLLQQVGARFHDRHPRAEVRVGDLSKQGGGTIRDRSGKRVHSSHRNGLDADIRYLHLDCQGDGRFDRQACAFDVRANLELMRMLVEGGPQEEPPLVDAFFIGASIKRRVCRWVKENPDQAPAYGAVLRRMRPMGGHTAHFHMRLRCPAHSFHRGCPKRTRPKRHVCGREAEQTAAPMVDREAPAASAVSG